MFRTTCVCLDCVSVPLLRRAVSLRLGPLGLLNSSTNIFRLADGSAEGLPSGTSLDLYGGAAILRASGLAPHASASVSAGDVRAITAALENSFAESISGAVSAHALTGDGGGGSDGGALVEFSLPLRSGPAPLTECGIVFPSPAAAGRCELRAARRAFALVVATLCRQRSAAAEPISVFDASEVDATMSRVAAGRGAADVCFAPLGPRAAAALRRDESLAPLVRVCSQNPKETEGEESEGEEEEAAMPTRGFAAAAITASPEKCAGPALAGALRAARPRGTVLLTVVDSARGEEALRQCARSALAEGLSRQWRGGAVVGEVLPAADCPGGGAVTLIVELD